MGVYIIANHKRTVVLFFLRHMQAARKYFNYGEKRGKFLRTYITYTYLSSKNKETGQG